MNSTNHQGNPHATQIAHALCKTRFSSEPIDGKSLCLLAFFNRSGSNLLAEYLRTLPGFHGFREQLNHEAVINYCTGHGIAGFSDYIKHLACTDPGPHFGLKASAGQIRMLADWNILAMFERTRVIHIERKDTLSQAVSFWIARHTLQWKSSHIPVMDEVAIPYDFDAILGITDTIRQQNAKITAICAELGLPIRNILYERLVTDPEAEMAGLLDFLGLGNEAWMRPSQTEHRRQDSETKKAFITRARADMLAKGRDPTSGYKA